MSTNSSDQRWLSMRLDLLGATLTFAVAISTVGARFNISSGQTGVVLSYILMVQQVGTERGATLED